MHPMNINNILIFMLKVAASKNDKSTQNDEGFEKGENNENDSDNRGSCAENSSSSSFTPSMLDWWSKIWSSKKQKSNEGHRETNKNDNASANEQSTTSRVEHPIQEPDVTNTGEEKNVDEKNTGEKSEDKEEKDKDNSTRQQVIKSGFVCENCRKKAEAEKETKEKSSDKCEQGKDDGVEKDASTKTTRERRSARLRKRPNPTTDTSGSKRSKKKDN